MAILNDPHAALHHMAGLIRVNVFGAAGLSFEAKLRLFLLNVGFRRPIELRRLRVEMDRLAAEALGAVALPTIFNVNGQVRSDILAAFGMRQEQVYASPLPDPSRTVVRDVSVNEYFDPDWPDPHRVRGQSIRRVTSRQSRRRLDMLEAPGGMLFADPTWFQMFSPDGRGYYPSGSPFALTRSALKCAGHTLDGDVVMIGDLAGGRNICHFTLCWLNRVATFVACRPERAARAHFVAPAAPTDYVELVVAGMCAAYGLRREQFLFPSVPIKLTAAGSLYWFYDCNWRINTHPAHAFHPDSVAHLRHFGAAVRALAGDGGQSDGPRKVYISRSDAVTRRVANEDTLWPMLEARGFVRVALSRLSPAEQVAIMAGADVIVGPHGAGFTHLAWAHRGPRVVELHNEQRGTDAYAGLARAMGCDYRWMLCPPTGERGDIIVDPDALTALLDG